MKSESFSHRAKEIIKAIPAGQVSTYGQIAAMAGNPRGARGVVWILHSSSKSAKLPWHRVINSKGKISLPHGDGYEEQRFRLEAEGIQFDERGTINLKRYLWQPTF